MNKSRKLSLINMCVNLVMIALEITGIYLLAQTQGISAWSLRYYTILTALVTFLAAALMIWANIVSFAKIRDCTPRLFYSIRFLSAVMSLLTFVTVVAFLYPAAKAIPEYAPHALDLIFGIEGAGLFVHFLCPIISIVQFIGFEIEPKAKFKKTLEPFIATVVYAVAILIAIFSIQATQGINVAHDFAPYFFFLVTPELAALGEFNTSFGYNIGIAFAVLAISYIASILLWTFNRICHAIFIGEEYVPYIATKKKAVKTTKKTTTAPIKKGNAITNYVKKKVAFGDDTTPTSGQIYHISYHDRRLKTWKVKSENAGRALKVFPSQKEAIAFANEQIKKNGGSIRVHSVVGQIRKE